MIETFIMETWAASWTASPISAFCAKGPPHRHTHQKPLRTFFPAYSKHAFSSIFSFETWTTSCFNKIPCQTMDDLKYRIIILIFFTAIYSAMASPQSSLPISSPPKHSILHDPAFGLKWVEEDGELGPSWSAEPRISNIQLDPDYKYISVKGLITKVYRILAHDGQLLVLKVSLPINSPRKVESEVGTMMFPVTRYGQQDSPLCHPVLMPSLFHLILMRLLCHLS